MIKKVAAKAGKILVVFLLVVGLISSGFAVAPSGGVVLEVQAEEENPPSGDDIGTAVLISILLGSGIRFVGAYDTVVKPGVLKLWNDFQETVEDKLTLTALGAGVAITHGYMRVSASVNNAVNGFMEWYRDTFSVTGDGVQNITISEGSANYLKIEGCTRLYTRGATGFNDFNPDASALSAGVRCVFLVDSSGYGSFFFVWPGTSGSISYIDYAGGCPFTGGSVVNRQFLTVAGVTYSVASRKLTAYPASYYNILCPSYTVASYGNSTAFEYTYGAEAGSDGDVVMEGQTYDLKDGFNLSQDQAKLYDISALDALVASLGLALENVADLARDVPALYDIPWSTEFPDAYPTTPDDSIPWVDTPDSVIPADTPSDVPVTPGDEGQYKILGLDSKFPFSLPFDFYYLIQAFRAEPECPSFDIPMYHPVTHEIVKRHYDLSQFEDWAEIIRVFSQIFLIGFLIIKTRDIIRA